MPVTHFHIVAEADPQTLVRLLNYFTQLGLLPRLFSAIAVDRSVTIHIEQPDLGEHQARVIAEKMRSSFLVESVRMQRG